MNADTFCSFVASLKQVREFSQKPISQDLLLKLIECASLAPSEFNLQPTHYVVVTDPQIKERVYRACFYQRQILDAAAIIFFTGDRQAVEHNLDEVIAQDIDEELEERLRRQVHLYFDQGILGINWLAKLCSPLLRLFTPMPHFPAVHKRDWLTKQVMLSVMNFILAAETEHLATSLIEEFDEWRVKYHLGIPLRHIVPVIAAVGYPLPNEQRDKRKQLPLQKKVHWNGWNMLEQ